MKRVLIPVISLLFVGSAYAKIYTWTDENGRTVYSQTQKRGAQEVEINVQPRISGESGAAPAESRSAEEQLEIVEEANKEQQLAQEQAKQEAQLEAERKQNCQEAKNSLALLQRGGTTRFKTGDGDPAYYSPEQRVELRKDLQAFIDENCQ